MQTAFRLAYSLVVAILFILFVILGTRTFYDEPDPPEYPSLRLAALTYPREGCVDEDCTEVRPLTKEEQRQEEESEQAQREYQAKWDTYEEDRADYHRNVFILSSVLGVAAVAAGLYLFRRVEAMPLGLLLGGLGVIIYGWAQAAEDFDEIGVAPLFAVVAVGLAVVLVVGYRFMGLGQPSGGEKPNG